jgi:hypothetical protein
MAADEAILLMIDRTTRGLNWMSRCWTNRFMESNPFMASMDPKMAITAGSCGCARTLSAGIASRIWGKSSSADNTLISPQRSAPRKTWRVHAVCRNAGLETSLLLITLIWIPTSDNSARPMGIAAAAAIKPKASGSRSLVITRLVKSLIAVSTTYPASVQLPASRSRDRSPGGLLVSSMVNFVTHCAMLLLAVKFLILNRFCLPPLGQCYSRVYYHPQFRCTIRKCLISAISRRTTAGRSSLVSAYYRTKSAKT